MMEHVVEAVSLRWYNACAWYAVTLARALAMTGDRVTVAGDRGTPALTRAEGQGLATFAPLPGSFGGAVRDIALIRAYRRFAREEQVTLVNVHTGRDHLLWAMALQGTGIPIVRTSGNQIPPRRHVAARFLVIHRAKGIIATCTTIRRYYTEGFGIPPEDIPVINGGVDTQTFAPGVVDRDLSRDLLGLPRDALVVALIGRYSPDKGHRYFFPAASALARREPGVRFVVAGWNAQLTEASIQAMAQESSILDRIVFPGRVEDVRTLIAAADIGVIASIGSETVCRIALEYAAMGLPVVAAATNVIPEVVRDGVTGIIAPPRDADAMGAALIRLAADRDLRRSFGSNARALAEREYTLTALAEATRTAWSRQTTHDR